MKCMSKYYVVIKINKISSCELKNNISGFRIKPQNSFEYGLTVGHMNLVDPNLIENVLKRKITKKLNAYLKYLMNVIDDDDSDPEDLSLVINDLNKYKLILMNRYSDFLDPYYVRMLLSKVNFTLDELKHKIKLSQKNESLSAGRHR